MRFVRLKIMSISVRGRLHDGQNVDACANTESLPVVETACSALLLT